MLKCNGEEYNPGERSYHKYRGSGIVSELERKNPDPTTVIVDLDIDSDDPTDEGETVELSIGLISREQSLPSEFIPHDESRETTPCEVCGTPTEFCGTKRCVNCWEVERRLDIYIRSPKARKHVTALIQSME